VYLLVCSLRSSGPAGGAARIHRVDATVPMIMPYDPRSTKMRFA
jgi:hypothetical protein